MAFSEFFLVWISSTLLQLTRQFWLCGSQVPQISAQHWTMHSAARRSDTRVERVPKARSEACMQASIPGDDDESLKFSWIRKRAYVRACRRATSSGGTMYRGRWWTQEQLLGSRQSNLNATAQRDDISNCRRVTPFRQKPTRRLRVMMYNVSSITAELYDTPGQWLQTQREADIIFLQEIHWCLGRTEATWSLKGWSVIAAPDERNRYSGVAVLVSHRVATPDCISCCTWVQGRVLQVRCENRDACLDLFCIYQWVRIEGYAQQRDAQRTQVWTALSRALAGLPARNLVVVAGETNSDIASVRRLVGKGILSRSSTGDMEFRALLEAHQLTALNSWGKTKPQHCATYTSMGTNDRCWISFLLV